MKSMTGFASRKLSLGGKPYRLEIKSLNHRFLDVKVRLTRELSAHELRTRALLQSKLSRGAVELKLEKAGQAGDQAIDEAPSINIPLAKLHFQNLKKLKKELKLSQSIQIDHLLGFRDIFETAAETETQTDHGPALDKEVTHLIQDLITARTEEGARLSVFFQNSIQKIKKCFQSIQAKRKECVSNYPTRIRDQVEKIFKTYPINDPSQSILESRIAQELAIVMDRTDIQEEMVRFEGHLEHFLNVLKTDGQIGKKLEFILQELGREINTLGNKAQDFGVSEYVVEIKTLLEQMREQVLNLE